MAILREDESTQRLLIEYGADIALVDFDFIRVKMTRRQFQKCGKDEVEDYIAQTTPRLAQVERRPKRSIATSDSVAETKE